MIENLVFNFLKDRADKNKPLLLALSGGPDSLALFYSLLPAAKRLNIELGVAHVDHRWRSSSSEEACLLKSLAEKLKVAFHLKTLDPASLHGNLEAACRQERLNFFSTLCRSSGYQAVLMGHHADDQSETVLKKALEGADLTMLGGLPAETIIDGLKVWRPLLPLQKKQIIAWLEQRKITPFEDATNFDSRFLRGRLRSHIIPGLSADFGKETAEALCYLGEQAQELRQFLEAAYSPLFHKASQGPFGICLDLEDHPLRHPYEIKFVVRKLCREAGVSLSREQVSSACEKLQAGDSNKYYITSKGCLVVDRNKLFCLPGMIKPSENGNAKKQDAWELTVKPCIYKDNEKACSNWKRAWLGEGHAVLPPSDYQLRPPDLAHVYPGSSPIGRWWSKAKVPAFMRLQVPVICQKNTLAHEFLTGKSKYRLTPGEPALMVRITYRGEFGCLLQGHAAGVS